MDEIPQNDVQLLTAARRGEERSFLALYNRHRTPLFRFAWRLTGSITAAEDVIQDCFLAVIGGASFHAEQGSLRAYLFGITRNLALRHLRIDTRECEETSEPVTAPGQLENLLSAERSEVVAHAVAALPTLQREALILFEYEELSLDEIAQIAGVEIGAVKARLHRARETLRHRLEPLIATRAERKCR